MRFSLNLLTAAILLQTASVYAASPYIPDAGQAIRILEPTNSYQPSDFKVNLQAPRSAEAKSNAKPGGATIQVSQFEIGGNSAIPTDVLQKLVESSVGKELTLAEIQDAADAISNYYHREGFFLAKAYLPRQEITDGKIKIEILEGKYDNIGLHNTSRTSDATLNRFLGDFATDDVVYRTSLERKLLLISDLPGTGVNSTLKPGSRVGTTALDVDIKQKELISGYVDADNYGNKYTGTNRMGVTVNVNSPLGIGDQLTTRVMASEGKQQYGRIAYQAPVGGSGLQLGSSFSEMDYRLGREFGFFEAHGTSRVTSAYGLYPIVRTRQTNLNASLQFDNTVLKDDVDLFESKSQKTINSWSFGLSGSAYDEFLGGGLNSFAVNYHAGVVNIQSADVKAIDDLSAGTDGHYTKIDGMFSRTQRITDKLSLAARLSGQLADNNLDSAEKFDVGGAQAVRAFKQGDSSGDTGWLANLDLHYSLTDMVVLNTFYDIGQVHINQDAWDNSKNKATKSGAGVGVDLFGKDWKVSMVGSWKVSGSTESTPDSHQFWVQLIKSF
ncbi:ShlB/FhaC/HecB family hemolysin secretion/activation protein [Pseudomonas serbica]|jgi:hemolysin activation/secretion protein|uniref:ShlB/FhaC/HecB family hemolysin secretion/activation protein n=1 Tax=Pseudomonas serbica TaxID=2965074 RepID=UPI00237C0BD1|nr:ShlB/FhaC/HecB family hemolysin secretion/activation protein [Pseudomonas serbica]